MGKGDGNIKTIILAIIIIALGVLAVQTIYEFFKAIYCGYKEGWNKKYLTFAFISLLLVLISIPSVYGKDYARLVVMGGLALTLYFIYKSRQNEDK